jgi:hypothetical protein
MLMPSGLSRCCAPSRHLQWPAAIQSAYVSGTEHLFFPLSAPPQRAATAADKQQTHYACAEEVLQRRILI